MSCGRCIYDTLVNIFELLNKTETKKAYYHLIVSFLYIYVLILLFIVVLKDLYYRLIVSFLLLE